jgi:hypothetical protein
MTAVVHTALADAPRAVPATVESRRYVVEATIPITLRITVDAVNDSTAVDLFWHLIHSEPTLRDVCTATPRTVLAGGSYVEVSARPLRKITSRRAGSRRRPSTWTFR